jgi:hypothetical protein
LLLPSADRALRLQTQPKSTPKPIQQKQPTPNSIANAKTHVLLLTDNTLQNRNLAALGDTPYLYSKFIGA